jgi:hypothetical protein
MRGMEDYWGRGIRHHVITQEERQAVLDEYERTDGRMDDPRPPPVDPRNVSYVHREAEDGIAGYVRRDGEVVPITYRELEQMNGPATERPAAQEPDSTTPPLPVEVDPAPILRPVPSPSPGLLEVAEGLRRRSVEMWDDEPERPETPAPRPPSPEEEIDLWQIDAPEAPFPDLVPLPEDDELNHHHFDRECRFCWDRMTNTMLIPCHHAVYCFTCANAMLERRYNCILCRQPIEKVVRMLGH